MKHALTVLAFIVAVCISNISQAQDERDFANLYLKGKWIASCPPEILDHASMQQCELCPFIINPNNKTQGSVKDIEMNFLADSIVINQNGKLTTVPYKRNKDNHAISFTLKDKTYNFRMFLDEKRRILEDSDGMILVLEKAN